MFGVRCSGTANLDYSFTRINCSERESAISDEFNDERYRLALVFRQELYSLKDILHELVTKVFNDHRSPSGFEEWWQYLNRTGNTRLWNGLKLYIDPANLLKVVARHEYFKADIFSEIRVTAESVYQARKRYYAHLEQLSLVHYPHWVFDLAILDTDKLRRIANNYLRSQP